MCWSICAMDGSIIGCAASTSGWRCAGIGRPSRATIRITRFTVGTRCRLALRQGPAERFRPELYVVDMDGTTQLLEADRRYLVHPLHHPDDHQQPLLVTEGKGAILRDAEGRDYIDGLSGLWNVNVGHGRAELADAAAAQMRRIAFASAYLGATTEPAIRLAEKIVEHAYSTSAAVYFTTAGAESNESAFKFTRYYWKVKDQPQKTKIVSRIHAYHGVTLAAM